MANGQRFDPDKLTAASWFYPLGTKLRVYRKHPAPLDAGQGVVVTVTDRGPARYLVERGRILDLTPAAFKQLGQLEQGLIPVRVEAITAGEMKNGP